MSKLIGSTLITLFMLRSQKQKSCPSLAGRLKYIGTVLPRQGKYFRHQTSTRPFRKSAFNTKARHMRNVCKLPVFWLSRGLPHLQFIAILSGGYRNTCSSVQTGYWHVQDLQLIQLIRDAHFSSCVNYCIHWGTDMRNKYNKKPVFLMWA